MRSPTDTRRRPHEGDEDYCTAMPRETCTSQREAAIAEQVAELRRLVRHFTATGDEANATYFQHQLDQWVTR